MNKNYAKIRAPCEFMEDLRKWHDFYPDRYYPGMVPTSSILNVDISMHFSDDIRARIISSAGKIEGISPAGCDGSYRIDARLHESLIPWRYYSDGERIEWDRLEESNRMYELRYLEQALTGQSACSADNHDISTIMKRIDDDIRKFMDLSKS